MQTMLRTTRFGDIEIDDARVFRFADGLPGFPGARSFLAMNVDDNEDLYWLQCLEDGALAFLAVSPWAYFPDYEPVLSDADQQALGLDDPDDAAVLCLLTVDRAAELITANLLGPLVLNTARRIGRQVVLADSDWPLAARMGVL